MKQLKRHPIDQVLVVAALMVVSLVLLRCCWGNVRGGIDFVRIGAVLAFLVSLLWLHVPVGIALLGSAVALGIVFQVGLLDIAHVLTFDLFNAERQELHAVGGSMLLMTLIIFLINVMGRSLRGGGIIERLIGALQLLCRNLRTVTAAIPAVFGLMPMPGGALLSAPIVQDLGNRLDISPGDKTLTNFWFRHVWEYWWPLYPGLIVAADLVENTTMSDLVRAHLPLSGAAILAGYVLILRRFPPGHAENGHAGLARRLRAVWVVLHTLWPVLFVVAVVGLVTKRVPAPLSRFVMPAALVVANAGLIFSLRLDFRRVRTLLWESLDFRMVVTIFSVYAIRGMFQVSGAAGALTDALGASNVPPGLIVFLVPTVVGMLTGYTLAAVSTTFPLLLGFLTSADMVMLAYVGGYLGVLASPSHLCLVLTLEYFQARARDVYVRILSLVAMVGGFAILWSIVLAWLLRA